jgi:hypothetical protein
MNNEERALAVECRPGDGGAGVFVIPARKRPPTPILNF